MTFFCEVDARFLFSGAVALCVRVVFEGIYEGCVCVLKGECAFAGVCVYGGSVCEEGCHGGGCDSPTQQKGQSSRTQFTISWLDDLS